MSDQKEDKLETKGGAKAAGNPTQIYKAKLVLKAWGQKSDDVYAPRGEKYLEFDAVVDDKGKCKTCGSADNVDYLQYHPGKCSAYEWVYGVDIDWRWLCCGKHEDFRHEKYCEPNGFHKTGCVENPVCTKCFKCGCRSCIDNRKEQLEKF